MTLRIERPTSEGRTTIRLMGRIGSEHLQELKEQLVGAALGISLDLDAVSLVKVEVVRFLGECEAGGVKILHCSTLHLGVDPSRNESRETIALDSRYGREGRVQRW